MSVFDSKSAIVRCVNSAGQVKDLVQGLWGDYQPSKGSGKAFSKKNEQ
jgi:hypothetical protein